MDWSTEKKRIGHNPFAVIEADMDYCARTWGVTCNPDNGVTIYSDSFSETSTTLLQNHTSEDGNGWIKSADVSASDWSIIDNEISIGSGSESYYYHDVLGIFSDQFILVRCSLPTAGFTEIRIAIRVSDETDDTSDRYYLKLDSNTWRLSLHKIVSAVHTQLSVVSIIPIAAGTTFYLELKSSSNVITGYLEGQDRVSATDSSVAVGGYTGVYAKTEVGGGTLVDTLTDTNGTLLESHTASGFSWTKVSGDSLAISSNQLNLQLNNVEAYYANTTKPSTDTLEYSADVTITTDYITGDSVSLIFSIRSTGSSFSASTDSWLEVEFYILENFQYVYINRMGLVGYSELDFSLFSFAFDTTNTVKVELDGDTINVYLGATLIASGTDATIPTGGYVGLYAYSAFAWTTGDFIIDNLTVASSKTNGAALIDDLRVSTGEIVNKDLSCRKTWPTCQDTSSFLLTEKTYTFYEDRVDAPITAVSGYPLLKSFKTTPSKITDGIGYRGTLTFRLSDFTHHDKGVDPHQEFRTYDARERGTFMGRFVKNNPFVIGRTVRLRQGYLTSPFSWDTFQTSEYVIDKIDGPDARGEYVVTCYDILYRLKDVMIPKPTQAKLLSGINSTDTTLYVDLGGDTFLRAFDEDGASIDIEAPSFLSYYDEDGVEGRIEFTDVSGGTPSSSTDTLYVPFYDENGTFVPVPLSTDGLSVGESVRLLIGDELMDGVDAGGTVSITARGVGGTVAEAHEAGDNVQKCITFDESPIDDAVSLLLQEAGVDLAKMNLAGWAEQVKLLSLLRLTTTLARPAKLTEILGKLAEQFTFRMWWDERAQLIEMLAMFPQGEASLLPVVADDLNILHKIGNKKVPPTATHTAEKMISQMWINFKKRDLSGDDELDNLGAQYIAISGDAEKPQALDGPKPKSLKAEFVNTEAHAALLASRWGAFYGAVQSQVVFYLADKDIEDIWLGKEFMLDSEVLQDFSGANDLVRMQVISAAEDSGAYKMTAEKSIFQGTRYAYIAAADATSYSTATSSEKATQAYICNEFGLMPDGTKGYIIV